MGGSSPTHVSPKKCKDIAPRQYSPAHKRVRREGSHPSASGSNTTDHSLATQRGHFITLATVDTYSASNTLGLTAQDPPVSTWVKSATFWYQDGNVIIKAETTCFRLYRSRLSKNCLFFAKLFETDDEDCGYYTKIDDCAVYNALSELKVDDSKTLLVALETPLLGSVYCSPAQSFAESLVIASQSVSCDIVFKFAKRHLCAFRDAVRPPAAPTYVMTLFPPTPTPASAESPLMDPSTARTHEEAAYIILLARRYRIPELLKRAFYELIASATFWDVVSASRKQTKPGIDDLLRLYEARHALQKMWRDAVLIEPPVKREENGTQ
ncbi:hypothetical protein BC628DRAFT_1419992 [Trametes gibbosa]|nr:hypothetical protein BC628DRAFT_1419992 [Trametes gibbosa]